MQTIYAQQALLTTGWTDGVRLKIEDGRIRHIDAGAPEPGDTVVDTLLPALGNLHSHSFQRAMAGMTEVAGTGPDSFWTWRDMMYRFLEHLSPDDIEAIAAMAFVEMLEAGYASVGEFHYVHHQPGGAPYDQLAELSLRILSGASGAGIGLTHLPVLYTYAGVTQAPLSGGQLRFGNDLPCFERLISDIEDAAKTLPADMAGDFKLGVAPHSLRAVSTSDLGRLAEIRSGTPIHIHIAEQQREVTDVQAALGARPVELLLTNAPVGQNWCLVHATHMTDTETTALASSGAVAGLCPITEANLGDGTFNGETFLRSGGNFGIGTDSNVRIAVGEELRTLEYSQRLAHQRRNVLAAEGASVGATLYLGAAKGGAQALGRDSGRIEIGALADLVAINSKAPSMCALNANQLLDGLSFASDPDIVTDVWAAGRYVVQGGTHIRRAEIEARFRRTMAALVSQL